MRHRRRELTHQLEGRQISGGVARTRNIYDTQRAKTRHGTLLEEIKRQTKAKFKVHKDNGAALFVDPEMQEHVALPAKAQRLTPPKVKQGCRHHTRKRRPVMDKKEGPTQATMTEQEEVFEGRRQALKAWKQMDTHIYGKGRACMGGAMTSTRNIADATMIIATLNVRGLNDAKLELALQHFVTQEWDILFSIDTQLDKKGGDYMEKES